MYMYYLQVYDLRDSKCESMILKKGSYGDILLVPSYKIIDVNALADIERGRVMGAATPSLFQIPKIKEI